MKSRDLELEADDRVLRTRNDLTGIFAIFRFGKGAYRELSCGIAFIIAATACVMASARLLGQLVEGIRTGFDETTVTRLTLSFLSLEALSILGQYLGRLYLAKATVEIAYQVRLELFRKIQRLPMHYFDMQPLGRTITRLTADVEGMEAFFGGTMAKVLTAMMSITVVFVAMLLTDPLFGSMMVAASLPSLIFSLVMRKPVRDSLRNYKRHLASVNAKFAENLKGMPVIRIFGLESWTQSSFAKATQDMFYAGLRTMNLNSLIRPATVFLCSLPTLLILWLGGEKVMLGTMPLASLIAFIRFSERFIAPIRTISQEIQNIQEALVSSERVRRMLSETEEEEILGPDGTLTELHEGVVEFQEVCMGYRSGDDVLKGISFYVPKGFKVGLVGESGSGKTSTVNLIPRLYPMTSGKILFDGRDQRLYQRHALRSTIGYVSQDIVMVSGSIRENLIFALADRTISDEKLLQACKRTGLWDVLCGLRGGLDYYVVEGGDNLSMGERQLIAFTRMLLRDPKILILDEATANIDERCEKLIQKATDEVMQGRTSFVIAHRLSTVVRCDLILVFSKGKIIEQGRHSELIAKNGAYAALAKKELG